MKTKQLKRAAAEGGDVKGEWNHAQPEVSSRLLRPALLPSSAIDVQKLRSPLTSADAWGNLEKRGAHLSDVPFRYFKEGTYVGRNRVMDGSDFLTGKEVLYTGLDHALETHAAVHKLTREIIDYYSPTEKTNLISSMELQDAPKVTAQQWKQTGWFLASPITDVEVPKISADQRTLLRRIALKYAAEVKAAGVASMSFEQLIMADSDPPDTMTGSPTFTSGDQTHVGRLASLSAVPSPLRNSPEAYVRGLDALGASMGMTEAMIYSPMVSTRTGPSKKTYPLFVKMPGGYEARFEATGAYNRSRFVYPAPYHVNFLLSPLYVWMSTARKRILGLWHDPTSQAKYIAKLRTDRKSVV